MNRVATRKWLEIVRFELFYQLRRRSTWILLGLFLMPFIGQTNGQAIAAREREILFHAPLFIAQSSVAMAMIVLLVMATVVGDAATRDVQTRLEPLMHAAPVGRAAYLGGRFLGAFIVCALLLLVVPLAIILAPFVHSDLNAELVGPFRPVAHVQAYFLLLLPNAFVVTALMFVLATLVRHTMGSYLGAALVVAGSLLSTHIVGRTLGHWELAKLLDPVGQTSLAVMARTWSPGDLNTRLIGLDGGLMWNRLAWLGLALAALAFAYARFRYGENASAARWWQRGRRERARGAELVGPAIAHCAPVVVPRAHREFGVAGRVRQTLTVARDSLRELVTRWSWLVVLLLVWEILFGLNDLRVNGTPTLPTTSRLVAILAFVLLPLRVIAFTLFAGELVWRERDANMQALTDAAPVPDGVRFVGKLLGLWLVIAALHLLLVLAGVLIQLQLGWYDFEPALYLQVLFGIELIGSLVFALFALSVHVLVNRKHLGHAVVVLSILLLGNARELGFEHPLLVPGWSPPVWRHSSISGFGPSLAPTLWFALYWAAWALLLAIVARLFWVRGIGLGIRERVLTARRRFTRRTFAAAAAVGGIVLLVGGFLFYNTNVLNEYRSIAAGPRRKAEYERQYGRYRRAPQPQTTATELDVEIYPDRREADVRGVHRVENRTPQPIDTIHVAVSSDVVTGEIDFGRQARATLIDDDLGHRIYRLDEPLQPGDSLRMSWQVRYASRGFPARDIPTAVVENGSFFVMQDWMPLIGYQPSRELNEAVERTEHGLVARPILPSLDDLEARNDPAGQQLVDLEVTVGTAADQIAIAPGRLRATSTRDGRRYFEYATDAPIGQGYAIFSADYAVHESRWRDVALEVVHHPAHDLNVPRMLRSMEASLEQFSERFGPYPHKVLRMVEYPAEGGSLHAASGTVWYKELFSLFDPDHDERRFDLAFAAVSHETAHQWWCGKLGYARVEGVALLGESLAWYSAMGVIEKEHGAKHLRRFLDFMRRAYLNPSSRADVPLLRASDWFLAYRKGPFAMYALREYVGQDKVDLALRRLLAQHASHQPPFPVSLDLYRELQAVTPDALQYLLHDLFEANTFWELKTERASAEETEEGAWHVTLDVHARKVVVDEAGVETEVPMDELVELGGFASDEKGEEPSTPLDVERHRIHSGKQTITLTVENKPTRAGIDPRHLLIDVEPDDNVVAISDTSRSRS